MTRIVVGALLVIGCFKAGGLIGFVLFWIGAYQIYKGYKEYSAQKAKDAAQAADEIERKRQEALIEQRRIEQEKIDEEARKAAEARRIEAQRAIAEAAGRDNLRRMVNELIDYSNSLEPGGSENRSSLSGMSDTLGRIAGDHDITESHKQDSGIQFDLRQIISHMQVCGLEDDRVALRIAHFLLRDPMATANVTPLKSL